MDRKTVLRLSRNAQIDLGLTETILSRIAADGRTAAADRYTIPKNSRDIIAADEGFMVNRSLLDQNSLIPTKLDQLFEKIPGVTTRDNHMHFTREALHTIGLQLIGRISYGMLNGGSATSYIDEKKNSAFYPPLIDIIGDLFRSVGNANRNRPKALTPAYLNLDGSPGYTFLEMKLRGLLLLMLESSIATGTTPHIPIFEMRSPFTERPLSEAYSAATESPLLGDLSRYLSFDIAKAIEYRTQPMVAAFNPLEAGVPGTLFTFTDSSGSPQLLPLPGGHGQNFTVLKDIYRDLYRRGFQFSYLVNIDNLGNIPDPCSIAITALSGSDAAFEFSRKTPMDVKGGILARNKDRAYVCADIGVAISREEVEAAEQAGHPLLFNCATGLFNLPYLTENLDDIIANLPIRINEQDKDIGRYAHPEQVTWEVLQYIPRPLILSVAKENRFLAAKLLSEMIVTSTASQIIPQLKRLRPEYGAFCDQSLTLQQGLFRLLRGTYGMKEVNGRWVPQTLEELLVIFNNRHRQN